MTRIPPTACFTAPALALTLAAGLAAVTGCESSGARYVETGGPDVIVSLDQIDIQDFERAADEMVQSLNASPKIRGTAQNPAILGITGVRNDTSDRFNTDLLTKRIRVALNKTGRMETTMVVGPGGNAEDPFAAGNRQAEDYLTGRDTNPVADLPDYTLSGRIFEVGTRAGRTKQVSYDFQLSLTDRVTGRAVWEDVRTITKQGKKNSVGM